MFAQCACEYRDVFPEIHPSFYRTLHVKSGTQEGWDHPTRAGHAHSAIMVTLGVFRQEARTFTVGRPIDLSEGHQVAELIHSVQRNSSPASSAPTRLFPGPPTAAPIAVKPPLAAQPARQRKMCPKCGAPMVVRTAQRGLAAGQQFWGCSQFP